VLLKSSKIMRKNMWKFYWCFSSFLEIVILKTEMWICFQNNGEIKLHRPSCQALSQSGVWISTSWGVSCHARRVFIMFYISFRGLLYYILLIKKVRITNWDMMGDFHGWWMGSMMRFSCFWGMAILSFSFRLLTCGFNHPKWRFFMVAIKRESILYSSHNIILVAVYPNYIPLHSHYPLVN